jgi:SNF2 family DNA or RNA helicase
LFLKEYCNYVLAESIIVIPIKNDVNKTVELIKKAIAYTDCVVNYSGEVSRELKDHFNREEEFAKYSQKALEIRNNNCQIDDFKAFKEAVESNLKGRVLYPLQFLSAYHLAFSQNACNFSVPGAGKTSIVYGAYTFLKSLSNEDSKKVDRIVIVGPLSSFGPWEMEYFECFGQKAKSVRLSGNVSLETKKQTLYSSNPPELLLLSYASLISIRPELLYYLNKHKCMLVLDEAHKIKNINDGIIAQTALELSDYCKSRVVLTGTPAPNGYEDLFNLFKFIWPQKQIIRFNKGQLRDMTLNQNDPRVQNLIDSISPFFIRIRKSDLNIPSATENLPIIFKMSHSQRRLYDIIERRFVTEIVNSREKTIHNMLARARMIRLMQLASNPLLLSEPLSIEGEYEPSTELPEDSIFLNDLREICSDAIPAKFLVARDLVRTLIEKGEKVIIWCCFTKSILGLSAYFESIGIRSKILFGSTPIEGDEVQEDLKFEETRESIIRDFHDSNSQFKVIIANSFAVSESISLHKACHNAIYFERTFNASHYIQSKDRIHRYGLKPGTKTNYYYLIAEDSIEETIHRRLFQKEQRLLEVIESMPIPLFNLITDDLNSDISEILKDYARRSKTL